MIQAPQTQYMPVQAVNAGQVAQYGAQPVAQPQYATPGVFYNYPSTSAYGTGNSFSTDKAQYNGVNIEVINPQGQGVSPFVPYQMPAQFVPVAQTYAMPQPAQVPVQPQAVPVQPAAQTPVQMTAAPVQTQTVAPAPVMPVQPQVVPAAIPAQPQPLPAQAAVPAPEVPAAAAPVVEQPVTESAAVSPVAFANRLNSDNADTQLSAMEEIALAVKNKGDDGKALIDEQIVDALVNIINKDTSALEGPSLEVIELRQKLNKGEKLSDEDTQKANVSTPLEKAEQNKQYALYTLAYMYNRICDETTKAGVNVPELKDLPAIETVVNVVKSNPDPMVRVGAIAALSHIARPEYKNDLQTIFDLAKEDEDADVAAEATNAAKAL